MKRTSTQTDSPFATTEAKKYCKALQSCYARNPLVLYVGSEVSVAGKDKRGKPYGLPLWKGLLQELARRTSKRSFVELPSDPWDAAEWVIRRCRGKTRSAKEVICLCSPQPGASERAG